MRILFSILICILLVSCSMGGDKNRVQEEKIIKIKKSYHTDLVPGTKKLTFHLNNRIVNQSICIIPYTAPDSSKYLFYLNGQGNDIYIFSIDSAKLVKTIKLVTEGPNGVGGMVSGFEVINFDSIYVTSSFIRRLFIVNSDAKVISTVDYSEFKQEYLVNPGVSETFANMRLGFKDGKIYMPFYPGYDEGNYKFVHPEEIRFIAEIDLEKKEAGVLNIGFPADYWDTNFYPTFFSFFIYKNSFYVHYLCDDRIVVSVDSKNWKTYLIPSKYIDVKKVVKKQDGWCNQSKLLLFCARSIPECVLQICCSRTVSC